ncbi:putative helicase [Thiovulum sp. ES]|nr:putative helicase [Thiovulum sp. ES]
MKDSLRLHEILNNFINYEAPEITSFEKALKQFSKDVPNVIGAIREKINTTSSKDFKKEFRTFLEEIQKTIHDSITENDIIEMLVQHILTEDIFSKVFKDFDYHKNNAISKSLQRLEFLLLGNDGNRKLFLEPINYYYEALENLLLEIPTDVEKQNFLVKIYEEFYKAYNPKKADTLGIIYTPVELVDFIIRVTDSILEKHFNLKLESENVAILDPATGTGNFVTRLMEYLPKESLGKKLESEIFANEIAILPYYIANLNIEYLYFKKTGKHQTFENIVLGDTLNIPTKRMWSLAKEIKRKEENDNLNLFSIMEKSDNLGFKENYERAKKERKTDFTVIIGNPPYNANQQNENDNNKNVKYRVLDQIVKTDYVETSTAQKTAMYDMYSRFYRWATDRIEEKGIVSFVTNSSFIDSKTFDGFRKNMASQFQEIYIVDLGGNARKGERDGNVFDIMVGVSIFIGVKRKIDKRKKENKISKVFYHKVSEIGKKSKINWLDKKKFSEIVWDEIEPDEKGNWLNQTDNDWDDLIALGTKETKLGKGEDAIFQTFSSGIMSGRDDWVYDFSEKNLQNKIEFFTEKYNSLLSFSNSASVSLSDSIRQSSQNGEDQRVKPDDEKSNGEWDTTIKWSRDLKKKFFKHLEKNQKIEFSKEEIRESIYRPFLKKYLYFNSDLNDIRGLQTNFFPTQKSENLLIGLTINPQVPFIVQSFKNIVSYEVGGRSTQTFPLYNYAKGFKEINITDFAVKKFNEKYSPNFEELADGKFLNAEISKIEIFHYVYAVLHFPEYREKYEVNLKQDLPRIPLYDDFDKFSVIGKQLLNLHVNFENITEFPIQFPKNIGDEVDFETALKHSEFKSKKFLEFFPKRAFQYKLGNRSAIEWVIDGYKEKKIKDPTIAEKFDNYNFENYKKEALSLLKKVTAVSLETLDLIEKLK